MVAGMADEPRQTCPEGVVDAIAAAPSGPLGHAVGATSYADGRTALFPGPVAAG
ncbi:hypothetical protein [Streptomyces sp. NPDC058751]|uniref:hypothetical protein n=1 Tax=Streptomyces sp. NPDC058751 TaxID=3346623 RepID=UPI0036BA8F4D